MTKRVGNLSTELSSFVQAQAGAAMFGMGDVYFLAPATSSTSQFKRMLQANGVTESHYSSNVKEIYAAMTEGRNDTLIVFPGSNATTEALTWDKRYTNVIGTHTGAMNQRSRITCATASVTPMVTISDEGSLYKNILFSQEGDSATGNAVPVYVTGHRPVFENCGFRNISATGITDNSHRSLKIGSAYDITFRNCQIGETSYDADSAASTVIEFSGTDAGKYLFYDCMILGAGAASGTWVTQGANVGGFTLFDRCLFHNSTISSLDMMTQGFSLSGTGNDGVFLKNCFLNGATDLESSDSGVLFVDNVGGAATGGLAILGTW
jgi:hypothetical protein